MLTDNQKVRAVEITLDEPAKELLEGIVNTLAEGGYHGFEVVERLFRKSPYLKKPTWERLGIAGNLEAWLDDATPTLIQVLDLFGKEIKFVDFVDKK
jgi:hypothetical protein